MRNAAKYTSLVALIAGLGLAIPSANATLMITVTDNGTSVTLTDIINNPGILEVSFNDNTVAGTVTAGGVPRVQSPNLGTVTLDVTCDAVSQPGCSVPNPTQLIITVSQTGISAPAGVTAETADSANGLIGAPGITEQMFVNGALLNSATFPPSAGALSQNFINTVAAPITSDGQTFTINFSAQTQDEEATMEFTQVPEPASLALFGTALVGLGAIRRRRRKDA